MHCTAVAFVMLAGSAIGILVVFLAMARCLLRSLGLCDSAMVATKNVFPWMMWMQEVTWTFAVSIAREMQTPLRLVLALM